MKLIVARELLLKPLQLAASIAERRPSLPVLANVLLRVRGERLIISGSDSEIELTGMINLIEPASEGAITVPARKFLDICRSLPENANIEIEILKPIESGRTTPLAASNTMQQLQIRCGRSKFLLATLPAAEFPITPEVSPTGQFSIEQKILADLLKQTYFAMAQQDVRHYLNGVLFELNQQQLNIVAADGHRLAKSSISDLNSTSVAQLIVPRKAVLELLKLLNDTETIVELILSTNQLKVITEDYVLTTKIIDSKFPDYHRVIPQSQPAENQVIIERDVLKDALLRTAILAHEKHRGVRLQFDQNRLHIRANNPEQEEAEDEIEVNYKGPTCEIGFNVSYLIDVLNVVPPGKVTMTLTGENGSVLLEGVNVNTQALYVVMPLRL